MGFAVNSGGLEDHASAEFGILFILELALTDKLGEYIFVSLANNLAFLSHFFSLADLHPFDGGLFRTDSGSIDQFILGTDTLRVSIALQAFKLSNVPIKVVNPLLALLHLYFDRFFSIRLNFSSLCDPLTLNSGQFGPQRNKNLLRNSNLRSVLSYF